MGLEPSNHTPKLNQIEAGQSQPKKQFMAQYAVTGPVVRLALEMSYFDTYNPHAGLDP